MVLPTNVWVVEFTHKNQVLLTWSLLKWPKYCFTGPITLVWRLMADVYCKIAFRDNSSEPDSEASKRVSMITTDGYYRFKVLLNIEHNSSSSSSLPFFIKQPKPLHHNSQDTWAGPPHFSYFYDIVLCGCTRSSSSPCSPAGCDDVSMATWNPTPQVLHFKTSLTMLVSLLSKIPSPLPERWIPPLHSRLQSLKNVPLSWSPNPHDGISHKVRS